MHYVAKTTRIENTRRHERLRPPTLHSRVIPVWNHLLIIVHYITF